MIGADVVAKAARVFLLAYDNVHYQVSENGELWLLERLCSFRVNTVFDVGANAGLWARAARSAHPDAVIHAFETSVPFWSAKKTSSPP